MLLLKLHNWPKQPRRSVVAFLFVSSDAISVSMAHTRLQAPNWCTQDFFEKHVGVITRQGNRRELVTTQADLLYVAAQQLRLRALSPRSSDAHKNTVVIANDIEPLVTQAIGQLPVGWGKTYQVDISGNIIFTVADANQRNNSEACLINKKVKQLLFVKENNVWKLYHIQWK